MSPPGFDSWHEVGQFAVFMAIMALIALAFFATITGTAVGVLWSLGLLQGPPT